MLSKSGGCALQFTTTNWSKNNKSNRICQDFFLPEHIFFNTGLSPVAHLPQLDGNSHLHQQGEHKNAHSPDTGRHAQLYPGGAVFGNFPPGTGDNAPV